MSDDLTSFIMQATEAAQRAYAPYSGYHVGALLLTKDGQVFTGCNVENASYPATICAERTALVKAVSEGVQAFDMMIVVTENGGSPCGICRQMLGEFAPEMRVICATFAGEITLDMPLHQLIVQHFGPKSLPPNTSS